MVANGGSGSNRNFQSIITGLGCTSGCVDAMGGMLILSRGLAHFRIVWGCYLGWIVAILGLGGANGTRRG